MMLVTIIPGYWNPQCSCQALTLKFLMSSARRQTACVRGRVYCVEVYFKQCISQIIDFLDFSKFPAKTIVTKLVGSCQQSKENMNVFVQTTKNTCLTGIVDQTFVVLHPWIAQISKFGFQKSQIHSSTMSFLLLVFFNPLLRYHANVHQIPGKIINQVIELTRSLEN